MLVRGRTSGKWQTATVVTVNGEIRFQMTGACGEKKFDLTWPQLIECTDSLDLTTCDADEYALVMREALIYPEVEYNKVKW